jgi:molecular chaperone GrpE
MSDDTPTEPAIPVNQRDDDNIVDAEIVETTAGAAELGVDIPADRDDAVRVLLEHLTDARQDAETYLDDLRRIAADFDNYRKRNSREQENLVNRAAERIVTELLPVLDTFDAAVSVEAVTDSERQLLAGMLGTREQLLKALEREGLEVIPTLGEEFDPEVHEPVAPADGAGTPVVATELRRGYRLNGRVLRAALVTLEAMPA